MSQLNRRLLSQLEQLVGKEICSSWIRKYSQQQENQHKKMNTPATNCTNSSWRKDGNTIDKIKRKRRINPEPNPSEVVSKQNQQAQGELEDMKNESSGPTTRILLKNKAVYFGQDCQLPYLQSSDAISLLYTSKSKEIDGNKEVILYNPPASIDSSYMTSLKSLHIYHTGIDSLRQLGTGWSSLKQLSILYGKLADLSGLSSFSSLEYLFVAFNQITSLSDLMFHPSIKCLDLQRNKIENMDEVEYLATMDKLENVNLNYNPVMKIKENKRLLQDKLGKLLELEDYCRLLDYQNQELVKYHQITSYEGIQVSNNLIKTCNQALLRDEISLDNLYQSYQKGEVDLQKLNSLDIVRYERKAIAFDESIEQSPADDEEIIFTPIIHFLSNRKFYCSIIKKYFQNRIYLNVKTKESSSQSPAHAVNVQSINRLNKFAASVKLEREAPQGYSLDNKESLTTDLSSLDKGKRTRLSLGKTRRLLDKFEKPASLVVQPKISVANFSATANPSGRAFTLKRSLLSKKPSIPDLQLQVQKKFAKTTNFKCD